MGRMKKAKQRNSFAERHTSLKIAIHIYTDRDLDINKSLETSIIHLTTIE